MQRYNKIQIQQGLKAAHSALKANVSFETIEILTIRSDFLHINLDSV